MAWEPQAQDHLESQQTKFGYVEDDVYFGGEIEKHLHASDTPRGYPDVYVNGEDVTVTVDPLKNAQWVLPGNAERHSFTVHRGALKDHVGVLRAQGIIDWHPTPPRNTVVTHADLDAADKFTPNCVGNSTRGMTRKEGPDWGKLPTISMGIWKNILRDKPDYIVDHEVIMENTHRDRTRAFDCGSYPWGTCR